MPKARNNHIILTILFALAMFLQPPVLFAQKISFSIDKNAILIGEPLNYAVRFTVPTPDYRISFELPDSLQHFEIMEKSLVDTSLKGEFFAEVKMKLTSWDSGQWYIPAIPIKIIQPGKATPFFLKSDPVAISVGYAKEDSTGQLRDIKSILNVPVIEKDEWWKIALGILGVLLAGYLFYVLQERRRKRPVPVF